ncbi:MAG: Rab family GTPase [Geminicoccaceae bacterium]
MPIAIMSLPRKKISVLGDYSVGKTSLVRRYVLNEFSSDYRATVGVKAYRHQDQVTIDAKTFDIDQSIWDIEGSRFGEQLIRDYTLGSSGALVVGDITRDDAILSMAGHARRFLELLPGRPLVFALNKVDLLASKEQPSGQALSDEFGGQVVRTSALTGEDVTMLFRTMLRRIVEIGA